MLGNITKQVSKSDTKELAYIFSKTSFRSVDGDRESCKPYLKDMIRDLQAKYIFWRDPKISSVDLPRSIIPDSVAFNILCYIHQKEPLTLPILLRYFTHKNLLQEAKDDLAGINQKLQGEIDKDLKDLQDKKAELEANKTNLNEDKIQGKEGKAIALEIDTISQKVIEVSSQIKEIEFYKQHVKDFFNGKIQLLPYVYKYLSKLESETTKLMEEGLWTGIYIDSQGFSSPSRAMLIWNIMDEIDKDLKDLQDKKAELEANKTNLNEKKIQGKEGKAIALEIDTISQKVIEVSSQIKEVESCKQHVRGFVDGKIRLHPYVYKYLSTLESEITKLMEEKLKTYIYNDTDIKKRYQSLNSKAKKILISSKIELASQLITALSLCALLVLSSYLFVAFINETPHGVSFYSQLNFVIHYVLPILLTTAVISLAVAGITYLIEKHYIKSFVKEMEDFIEVPRYIDKATNTEDVEKLEQKETNKTSELPEDPSEELSAQSNEGVDITPHTSNQFMASGV